jgi:hypothetical protein
MMPPGMVPGAPMQRPMAPGIGGVGQPPPQMNGMFPMVRPNAGQGIPPAAGMPGRMPFDPGRGPQPGLLPAPNPAVLPQMYQAGALRRSLGNGIPTMQP